MLKNIYLGRLNYTSVNKRIYIILRATPPEWWWCGWASEVCR